MTLRVGVRPIVGSNWSCCRRVNEITPTAKSLASLDTHRDGKLSPDWASASAATAVPLTAVVPPIYCSPGFSLRSQQLARESGGQFYGEHDSLKDIVEP